tara:strand:- start:2285 stop:2416 length:132 start_codon:yes stop_codon:yes gene_type:complete
MYNNIIQHTKRDFEMNKKDVILAIVIGLAGALLALEFFNVLFY